MSTPAPDPPPPPPSTARVAFDRLRERTDELELLTSGLAMIGLLALPGWLIDRYVALYTQLPLAVVAGVQGALPFIIAIAYTLAFLFMLHLGTRAYWVSLIGLKAVFPYGIRWDAAHGIGPISRERLREQVPGVEPAIERADRLASVLFAVIALSGLILLWLGVIATITFVAAASIGSLFDSTNRMLNFAVNGLLLLIAGSLVLLWLSDSVLARRVPALRQMRAWRAWVIGVGSIVRLLFPPRLVAPVRLMLQTNTRPRLFLILFVPLLVLAPWLGVRHFNASLQFETFTTQAFMRGADLSGGMRSMHYESQRTAQDRVRPVPMIPDPLVVDGWLQVFLPYWPLRDDAVLRRRCAGDDTDDAPRPALRGAECMRRLWSLQLDGVPLDMDVFLAAERHDLGYRGLAGFVDLRDGTAGLRRLDIVWRPDPESDGELDDYVPQRIGYSLPFVWAPEWAAEPTGN
jgi:hypothetical protein